MSEKNGADKTGRQSPSMAQVAKICGLSKRVVSAVLSPRESNQHIRFSEETKKRIEEVAQDIGYRPNRTWQNAVQNRNGSIGVLCSAMYKIPGNGAGIADVYDEAAKKGYLIHIEVAADRNELPLFLKENVVDGLLLFEPFDEDVRNAIRSYNIPAVYVNAGVPEEPHTVEYDDAGGMKKAVEFLIQQEDRQIAFIHQGNEFYNQARIASLQEACEENGAASPLLLDVGSCLNTLSGTRKARQAILQFLRAHPDVNAVLLQNNYLAGHCYDGLRANGKTIPEDAAMVGLGPGDAFCFEPPLSHLALEESGCRLATKRLCEMIAGGSPAEEKQIGYELVHVGSTQSNP